MQIQQPSKRKALTVFFASSVLASLITVPLWDDVYLCDKHVSSSIADAELRSVFKGAVSSHKLCTVNARDLEDGHEYWFNNGLLLINGDVPRDVTIQAMNAKVLINGDIGENSEVKSYLPICTKYAAANKTSLPSLCEGSDSVYKFAQDSDPSIILKGMASPGVTLQSNGSILVNEKPLSSDVTIAPRASSFSYSSERNNVIIGWDNVESLYISPLLSDDIKRVGSSSPRPHHP
jgi:hypothetical protein